jgi:hypothetical protein
MKARCFVVVVALPAVAFTCVGSADLAFAAVAFTSASGVAVEAVGSPPTGRVQLLQSSMTSPRARRCLTRIREELAAGGFDVVINEFGADNDALWSSESAGPRDSLATITLVGNPDDGAAELWIVDGGRGERAAIRRLLLPAGAGTHEEEVLAVRTLEFLRARALELAQAGPPPPAQAAAPIKETVSPSLPPPATAPPEEALPAARVALELGAGLLESSRALGPAYVPFLGVRTSWLSVLEVRLSVAAFGSRPRVTSQERSAAVRQSFGLLEVRAAFRRGHIVRPCVGIGGGALLVQVDGAGNAAYDGLRGQQWAGFIDAGGGLTFVLGHRLALSLEGHVHVATPYPVIQFAGAEAARLGRPAFLGALTLVTPLGGGL